MDEMYKKAVSLLAVRDYSAADLAKRLTTQFGKDPSSTIAALERQGALNDRRFAENFAGRHPSMSAARLRAELLRRGIDMTIINAVLEDTRKHRPSLRAVMDATMIDRKLQAPLSSRDAGRLFRALSMLGYPEDEIREELERLHEQ